MKDVTAIKRRLDDLVKPEVGRWLDWTPTITQLGSVTVTVTYARYIIIQNQVTLEARLAVTGAGTTNNTIVIGGLPTGTEPARTNSGCKGSFILVDISAGLNYVGAVAVNGTAAAFRMHAHGLGSPVGVTPNFGLASGDTLSFLVTYER